MKKRFILSLLVFSFLIAGTANVRAQGTVDRSKLMGTWQQCDSTGKVIIGDAGVIEYKMITPEAFSVIQARKEDHICMVVFFGTYNIENDIYTETLDFATPGMVMAKGGKNAFYISMKNDLLYIKGINNSYNQIWKKAEKL